MRCGICAGEARCSFRHQSQCALNVQWPAKGEPNEDEVSNGRGGTGERVCHSASVREEFHDYSRVAQEASQKAREQNRVVCDTQDRYRNVVAAARAGTAHKLKQALTNVSKRAVCPARFSFTVSQLSRVSLHDGVQPAGSRWGEESSPCRTNEETASIVATS
jgi:hypothetical protein